MLDQLFAHPWWTTLWLAMVCITIHDTLDHWSLK